MYALFADTSGWGNLVDISQPFHTLAAQIYRSYREKNQKVITTNYVITELVALMTSPLHISRNKTVEFVEQLKKSPFVELVHIDEATDERAWKLLTSRPDKEWSLVDCSSFVVMQELGVAESLTTDHHFEQAGFVRLLK